MLRTSGRGTCRGRTGRAGLLCPGSSDLDLFLALIGPTPGTFRIDPASGPFNELLALQPSLLTLPTIAGLIQIRGPFFAETSRLHHRSGTPTSEWLARVFSRGCWCCISHDLHRRRYRDRFIVVAVRACRKHVKLLLQFRKNQLTMATWRG
jgi:hypothetical protein